jgi:hypothetical protein
MKALEVSIDGKIIGIYVPPEGRPFSAMVANIPRKYMRAQVLASSDEESWQWQLPDISEVNQSHFGWWRHHREMVYQCIE